MKLSLSYIRKTIFLTLSLASLAAASDVDIKRKKEENLDVAYLALTTTPVLAPILAFSGIPIVPLAINVATGAGSQWALCELLKRDEKGIKYNPHTKRFVFSLFLALGSIASTGAYFYTGSNTYWLVNALCSTSSSLLTMIGTGIMYEELCPKYQQKEKNISTFWRQCTMLWKAMTAQNTVV